MEYEPTDSGKKRIASGAASMFEFEPTPSGKKSIRPGTHGKFIDHDDVKYTKEEIAADIREGDFFSFRDQAMLRELEMPGIIIVKASIEIHKGDCFLNSTYVYCYITHSIIPQMMIDSPRRSSPLPTPLTPSPTPWPPPLLANCSSLTPSWTSGRTG